MSASDESERRSNATEEGDSVLAKLPRTRPQRSSPRRAAARRTAAGNGRLNGETTRSLAAAPQRKQTGAKTPSGKSASGKSGRSARTDRQATSKAHSEPASATSTAPAASARRRGTARAREPIPMQGFEADGERARGPVHPPGGAELFASAVEMIGDLTKSSLASGERLVRDVLGRFLP